MTRFAQQFTRLGSPLLIRQFGELVTYFAEGVGGGRAIQAIVERDVQVITDQGIPALQTLVTVRNDATLGITATEIDTGTDTLRVAMRVGETPQVRQIVRVVSTENGHVQFEVN